MSDFSLNNEHLLAASFDRQHLTAASFNAAAQPVVIDVGTSATAADVIRDGIRLPPVSLDRDRIIDIIGEAQGRRHLKVVSQGVEAGRAVERGSTVDLVLTETGGLTIGVIEKAHPGLVDLTFENLRESARGEQPMWNLLNTKGSAQDLTADDKAVMVTFLETQGADVDPDDDDDVDMAFASLQAARLFGGG